MNICTRFKLDNDSEQCKVLLQKTRLNELFHPKWYVALKKSVSDYNSFLELLDYFEELEREQSHCIDKFRSCSDELRDCNNELDTVLDYLDKKTILD